ncbi:MAG TPA: hypothetical protein VGI78_22650, partial [Acetobacteraceae bacterium]
MSDIALEDARPAARVPEVANADAVSGEKLQDLWETKGGALGWFTTVDHKEIGLRYIFTAFVFLLLGG